MPQLRATFNVTGVEGFSVRCASCGSSGPDFDVPVIDYVVLITFLLACLLPALFLR